MPRDLASLATQNRMATLKARIRSGSPTKRPQHTRPVIPLAASDAGSRFENRSANRISELSHSDLHRSDISRSRNKTERRTRAAPSRPGQEPQENSTWPPPLSG